MADKAPEKDKAATKKSSKLKASTVKDVISRTRTMTGSRPDQIDINPIKEEAGTHAVVGLGRFAPFTRGHEKLVNAVKDHAAKVGGQAHIITTHSYGDSKNPIPVADKVKYIKAVAGKGVNVSSTSTEEPTLLHQMSRLHKQGVQHLTMVAGQDRAQEYHNLLHKYNGVQSKHGMYNFKSINVVSAGNRDPKASGDEGVSGTKVRAMAHAGDREGVKNALPKALHPHVDEIIKHIKSVKENVHTFMDATDVLLIIEHIRDTQQADVELVNVAFENVAQDINEAFGRE